MSFICEYQGLFFFLFEDKKKIEFYFIEQCRGNSPCIYGTCYTNAGESACVCTPGYTGVKCDEEIDECLSSPCLHNGNCTDQINGYICDCSATYYEGVNCEIGMYSNKFFKKINFIVFSTT